MSRTNKMLVCEETKKLKTVTADLPELPQGGLMVKVEYCGICHSDAHLYSEENYSILMPRVLGHEIAGTVNQIDTDCKDKNISVGDRVVVFCFGGCRKCEQCLAGYNTCENPMGHHSHTYGLWRDGGYQQFMAVEDPWSVVKVPDDIPLEKACVVPCSGVTAYNALKQSEDVIKKAQKVYGKAKVLVTGVGGLGLWAIEFAKVFYGDSVIVGAVDLFQDKLDHAKITGADSTVLLAKEDDENTTVEKIKDTMEGAVDVVIDFVGLPSTIITSLKVLNPGGTLALVGLGSQTFPPVKLGAPITANLRIQLVYVGHKYFIPEIFKLLSSKKVKGPPTKTVKFEEIGPVLNKLANREPFNGRFVAKI